MQFLKTNPMKTAIAILCLIIISLSQLPGNEPLWTPEERIRQRDAVVTASVTRVVDLGQVDVHSRLISAELKIVHIAKPHSELKSDTLTIYYLGSHSKSKRCPNFTALEVGMSGDFYLTRTDELTRKADFILAMGSDFRAAASRLPAAGAETPSRK